MKIAVVGLGAVGAQTFWQLSKLNGLEVHGYDTAYPGHPFAGAGGESRLFRNCELSDLGYLPLIRRADEVWRELEHEGGRRLRILNGVLLLGESDNPQVHTAVESMEELGKPYELMKTDLRKRFPQFRVGARDVGVWDTEAGVILPERSVAVAAGLAVRNGAQLHSHSPVAALEHSHRGIRLRTRDGVHDFDRVVVACGGWTTQLLPELREEVVTRRLTSAWFVGAGDEYLRGLPPFMRVAPNYCYGIPTRAGDQVKLGLGFNDHYPTGDPDRVPRELSGESAADQIARFRWILGDLLPGLYPDPVRLDTYIESYTRSMHEYVRLHPDHSDLTVMTGFSGHGFKLAPAIGEIGAQLVTEGRSEIDIGFLRAAAPVFDIEDPASGTTTHNPVVASTGASH